MQSIIIIFFIHLEVTPAPLPNVSQVTTPTAITPSVAASPLPGTPAPVVEPQTTQPTTQEAPPSIVLTLIPALTRPRSTAAPAPEPVIKPAAHSKKQKHHNKNHNKMSKSSKHKHFVQKTHGAIKFKRKKNRGVANHNKRIKKVLAIGKFDSCDRTVVSLNAAL